MAFGLSATGFTAKQQQDIISEIQTSLRAAFGQNINLLPEAVFGQIVGLFSEREALIWQLGEAVYNSQYPGGAEGTSVDNILALNALTRLAATPSRATLTLFGTPATLISAGSLVAVAGDPTTQFSTDNDVTIAAAVSAIQTLAFTSVPDSGAFALSIVDPASHSLTTPSIKFNALAAQTQITFGATPTSGVFKLVLTAIGAALTTANINWNDNAAAIQGKITALSGYSGVTVSGSIPAGLTITWGAIKNPAVTFTGNTLSPATTLTSIDSVQSAINNLHDVPASSYPYKDVIVSGSYTVGFQVNFLGTAGSQAQNLFTVASNTLEMSSTVTNVGVLDTQDGAVPQGSTTATCTVTGPKFAPANTLTVISTPVSGWSSVTNPLDAIVGTNIETDTEALARRQTLLASNSNGPLQGIVEKVRLITGVTEAIGFENLEITQDFSTQFIKFSAVPTAGQYKIRLGGVPGDSTAFLNFNDPAATVQAAITSIIGYSQVTVTGDYSAGFILTFPASFFSQPAIAITASTLTASGPAVTTIITGGRPAKSFEIVANGGAQADIAQAIYNSKPAGIATFGNIGPIAILDSSGFTHNIFFSRPTLIPIYISITLTTTAAFPADGVSKIQAELVAIVAGLTIGQTVIVKGTDGLVGAFNDIAGITNYTLLVGTAPSPSLSNNLVMKAEQLPTLETFNVVITVT